MAVRRDIDLGGTVATEPAGPVLHRRDLPFDGLNAARAGLTFGQKAILMPIMWYGPEHARWFDIAHTVNLTTDGEPALDLDKLLAALRQLVSEHESLRTRLVPMTAQERDQCHGPDNAACPQPHLMQQVAGTGSVPVVLTEVAGSPSKLGREALVRELTREPFQFGELPIRAGVAMQDERARWLVLVTPHYAADGASSPVLERAIRDHLAGTSEVGHPLQPRDVAAVEASVIGRQRHERAVGFWMSRASGLPSYHNVVARTPRAGRWVCVVLRSPAAAVACRQLARQLVVSDSAVLLAAASIAAHRVGVRRHCNWKVVTSNRFVSEFATAVGAFGQDCLVVVDGAAGDVRDRAAGVAREMLSALRHSRFDAFDLADRLQQEERRRGGSLDFSLIFNDVRRLAGGDDQALQRSDSPGVPSAQVAHDLLDQSEIVVDGEYDLQDWSMLLQVDQVEDSLELSFVNDTMVTSEQAVTRLLRTIEALLVESLRVEAGAGKVSA